MEMESSINKIEQKRPSALELFNLDSRQKLELKNRVSESNGTVRIFIHPMSILTNEKEIENQKRVSLVFKRIIFSEQSSPIIIFENGIFINRWKEVLQEADIPKDIYLVPTIFNYPHPIVPGKPEITEKDEKGQLRSESFPYVEEGIKLFVQSLNEVGVTKVLIGGTKLEITDGQISRCVGNFIRLFKNYSDIETKLSLGTAPLNRNDVRESHPDLI